MWTHALARGKSLGLKVMTNPKRSRPSATENESDSSYRVGYKKPPVHTQFKKGHRGYRRGMAKRAEPKGFLEELLDELNQPVAVTENGKPRKLRGMKAAAKNMAQSIMRGDARARAQFIQLTNQYKNNSARETPQKSSEKPRRSLDQIMRDFANDMWNEAYEISRELTGKDDFTIEEIHKSLRRQINEKMTGTTSFDSFKIYTLMLVSLRKLRECLEAQQSKNSSRSSGGRVTRRSIGKQ